MIKMKRLSTIIMALALVLGMSQCKKQETPTNGNGGEGEMVHITLNVNDSESLAVNVNDNGGRHAVAPSLGVVQFTNGDKLYVGNNGHYVGYLNYVVDESGRRFEGNINGDACSTSDNLHFYFLGGKGPDVTTISGNPESFTIDIANQTSNLPVLCYGASSQKYKTTTTNSNYTAVLEYKCALVRFNLKNDVYDDVTLSNVLTEATINFANNAITPTTTKGDITLYGEDGVVTHRWGILLPGTDLSHTTHPDLLWQEGSGDMPTVDNNTFVNAGGNQGFQLLNPPYPAPYYTLAVHNSNNKLSVFSVSATQKVYFSRANLMYKTAEKKWGFHDNQVDECSTTLRDGGYVQQSEYQNTSVHYGNATDMDRFTWGYRNVTAQAGSDCVTGDNDLSVERGTDWGCVFKIGDTWEVDMPEPEDTHWRTLTASEWDYLTLRRSGNRFMMVKFKNNSPVAGDFSYGLLLFPDNFEFPNGLTNLFNASNCNKTNQYYLIDNFGTGAWDESNSNMYKLLAAGAVFLPGVGLRWEEYYYRYNYYMWGSGTSNDAPQGQGYYWSASTDSDTGTGLGSHYFWFGIHGGNYWPDGAGNTSTITETVGVGNPTAANGPGENGYSFRKYGMCVRLVWDAN